MELNKPRLEKFNEEIMKLLENYPEFYIETWGPEEYIELCSDITIEECEIISKKLRYDFDPHSGTNISLIESTIENELERE